MSVSMEFKGFKGRKKRRSFTVENKKMVDETFKCMIQGDKMHFLDSNFNEDRRKFANSNLRHISVSPTYSTTKSSDHQTEAYTSAHNK